MILFLLGFLLLHLLFAGRKVSEPDAFFLVRRNLSWPRLGMSLSATILGASAVLGTVGWGYDFGLAGASWLLAGAMGLGLLWLVIPRLPRQPHYSLAHLVSAHGGEFSRKAVSLVVFPMWLAVSAAQIKALTALFTAHSPIPSWAVVVLVVAVVSLYVGREGQRAVLRSDAFQFVFIIVAVAGGFSMIWVLAPTPSLETVRPIAGEVPLWALFPVMLSYPLGPDIHSRLLTSSSVRDRRRALAFSMVVITAVALMLAAIGWMAHPLVNPSRAWETGILLVDRLPFALALVMNLALCAALLSSLDTTILTTATLVSVDLANRGLGFTRVMIVVSALAAGIVSLAGEGIIPLLMLAYQWYAGVLGPVVLFSLFGKRPIGKKLLFATVFGSVLILAVGKAAAWPFAFEGAFAWGVSLMGGGMLRHRKINPQ